MLCSRSVRPLHIGALEIDVVALPYGQDKHRVGRAQDREACFASLFGPASFERLGIQLVLGLTREEIERDVVSKDVESIADEYRLCRSKLANLLARHKVCEQANDQAGGRRKRRNIIPDVALPATLLLAIVHQHLRADDRRDDHEHLQKLRRQHRVAKWDTWQGERRSEQLCSEVPDDQAKDYRGGNEDDASHGELLALFQVCPSRSGFGFRMRFQQCCHRDLFSWLLSMRLGRTANMLL